MSRRMLNKEPKSSFVVGERKRGEALEAALKGTDGSAVFVQADVCKVEDIEKVFQVAQEKFGPVDAFIANAGIEGSHDVKILDETFMSVYQEVMKVNLESVVQTCRVGVKHLNKEKGFCLIISSVNSSISVPGFSAYCMSKAGCDALTRCLADEVEPHIQVFSVNPYLIQSEMTGRLCATFEVPDVDAWAVGNNPSGKVGQPHHLAELMAKAMNGDLGKEFPSGSNLLTDGHVLFHAREAIPLASIKGTAEFEEKIQAAAIGQ